MKKIYLLFLTLSILSLAHAQYTWFNKNAFPGSSRTVMPGFSINGVGYMVGGFTQYPGVWVNEVWAYNPTTDAWTQKNNFPVLTADQNCLSFNDSVYLIGGYIGNGNNSSNSYLYNSSTDSWTSKASFPENGIAGAFSFVINNIGYVGSGERNGSNNSSTAYAYNPSLDSWTAIANYPESRVNTVGFAIDSLGFVGLGSDGSNNLSSGFYKYSPSLNTWVAIAAFPGEPRSSAISFVLDGKGYVGGGFTVAPGNQSVKYDLSSFYQYDPSTDTWTAVSGLPGKAKQSVATFVIGKSAYIVGGYDDYALQTLNTVNEFGTCDKVAGIAPVTGGSYKTGMVIYPNPSTNEVTVKIDNEVSAEINYNVISVDGKLVKSGVTRQSTFGFSANSLSNGVYILTIKDIQGVLGEKRFEVIH